MRLRTTLTISLVTLAVVGCMTSLALIVLTTLLDRTSVRLDAAVASVHLAEGAVATLLLHDQSASPENRAALAAQLHRTLDEAGTHVTSEREGAVLATADDAVLAYLDPVPNEGEYERALSALHGYVTVNLEEAGAARAEAASLNRVGHVLGLVGAIGLPAALLLTMAGLGRSFRAVLDLGDAMERFGAGHRDARAPLAGPTEVREMATQFNAMATSIARQRDLQLAFLAGVAHDLRNPLAAIRVASFFLRADRLPADGAVQEVRDRLVRQVDHLDRMLGDLVESARIDAGHLSLVRGEHDVRAVARDVVDLFRPVASDHRLVLKVPSEPVVGRYDATRLAQVLTNLVSNAIKYSPAGAPVEVTVDATGDAVCVTVRDEGVGIPREELDEVFQPFRRGRAEGHDVPGSGLGLYVSRKIVEAHGGRIDVDSEPGRGSSFVVRLPLRPAA